MEESEKGFPLRVNYNAQDDTLTFNFTPAPEAGVAEEAGDEVWVRYNPDTRRVLTVDVLNFSKRVRDAFGPNLVYSERADAERIESILGLPLATKS